MRVEREINIKVSEDELEMLKCAVKFTKIKMVADLMSLDVEYTKGRLQTLFDNLQEEK